jgi:hypothetical protein
LGQVGRPVVASVTLQFLVKKPREQRRWNVEKIGLSLVFLVSQLPKITEKVREKNDVKKI